MTETTTVRDLTGADAADFQTIRLRSLKDYPEAFASAYEDEKDTPLEKAVEVLNQPTTIQPARSTPALALKPPTSNGDFSRSMASTMTLIG